MSEIGSILSCAKRERNGHLQYNFLARKYANVAFKTWQKNEDPTNEKQMPRNTEVSPDVAIPNNAYVFILFYNNIFKIKYKINITLLKLPCWIDKKHNFFWPNKFYNLIIIC